MMIFGKRFSEYVSFARVFLILIPLVGLLRLGLSLEGLSDSTVRWASMTVLAAIGLIYFSIRVHTTRFGSYKQLLVVLALQNIETHVISILGILLSIITSTGNIYSAPEFSAEGQSQWPHVEAHLLLGMIAGSLVAWLIGSLILFVTRMVSRAPKTA